MIEVEVSSGNIFADVGRTDADEAQARSELMRKITRIIKQRHPTQAEAARVLDTNQFTVSDLMDGKLGKFSLGRLIGFLNALDYDVEITVKQRPARSRRPARVVVAGD